jgi:tetratricopeptide (TPR) repeat protein
LPGPAAAISLRAIGASAKAKTGWERVMKPLFRFAIFCFLAIWSTAAIADTWDDCAGNDFQKAITACSQIIKAGKEPPKNMAMAYSNRARAYYYLGQNDSAISDATKAVSLNSRYANAYINRGNAWFAKEDFNKAAADYAKAIESDSKSAAAHFNYGLAHHRLEQYEKAIPSFDTAIKLDPGQADYWKTRGNAKYNLSRYQESLTDYNKAIQLNPSFGYAHYDRGLSYEQLKEYQAALSDFRRAAELIPESDSWNQEAKTRAGLMEDNIASLGSGGTEDKSDSDGAALAESDWDNCAGNDDDKSIAACAEIIAAGKEPPKNMAMAYSNKARAHYHKNEHDQAIDDASEAIRLNPNFTNAYLNRGNAYFGKEEFEKAADDYASAIGTNKKNPDAHFNFGLAHHRMKNYEKAIASFDTAISLDSKSADYYKTRGNAKYNLDRYRESIGDYDKAIQLNPSFGYAHYDRGLSYEQLGEFQSALDNFRKAANLIPQSDSWQQEAESRVALMQDKLGGKSVVVEKKEEAGTDDSASKQVLDNKSGQRKLALVIGNGAYRNATELPNPANDASAMAQMLADMGFDVIDGIDLDKRAMDLKVREFIDRVDSYDIALLFYAGHGISVAGKSYLLPVDAILEKSSALEFEAVEADKLYQYMAGDNRTSIVLLDACRNNPFTRSFSRSLGATRAALVGQGLAAPNIQGGGILIGFATAPGDVAADGEGRNSPFTEALLKHLPEPGVEIEQAMKRVKADVYSKTNGRQRPWHNSDLIQSVFLQ